MRYLKQKDMRYGFTIVELLIVIVVIAILASISVVAYNGVQDRSRNSKVAADISQIIKAIQLARTSRDTVLLTITGSGCSGCSCPYSSSDTTPYWQLPKTHACWTRYVATLGAISNASGVNLSSLESGDPWGAPYIIDENELEGGSCANRDSIRSNGKSGYSTGGTYVSNTAIPFYRC